MPDSPPRTTAVQLKIPSFWRKDPEVWFIQLERQFALNNITTDQTKFNHIVSLIDTDVLSQVRNIVVNPPEAEKYKTLKQAILDVYAESEHSRFQRLTTGIELGDRKPSQLLSEMKRLAGNTDQNGSILKTLWMQKLPETIRVILSAAKQDTSLDDLAAQADKTMEVVKIPTVQAVSPYSDQHVAELSKRMDELSLAISELRSRSRSRSRSTSSSRYMNRSFNNSNDSGLCWYHRKFGNRARKCTEPCIKKSKN